MFEGETVRVVALHPARNIADAPDRFEIDPADHFRALRSARGNGCEIVGCYHSHPNGSNEPSRRDSESASEEDFVWIIAAVTEGRCEFRAFVFDAGHFAPLDPASGPAGGRAV